MLEFLRIRGNRENLWKIRFLIMSALSKPIRNMNLLEYLQISESPATVRTARSSSGWCRWKRRKNWFHHYESHFKVCEKHSSVVGSGAGIAVDWCSGLFWRTEYQHIIRGRWGHAHCPRFIYGGRKQECFRKWSIRKKFECGEYMINTERFLVDMYLLGVGSSRLAQLADLLKIPTVTGGKWNVDSIMGMFRNEKYKGDFHLQKYYT